MFPLLSTSSGNLWIGRLFARLANRVDLSNLREKKGAMSITRRELFRGLPILGLPALLLPPVARLEAASQQDSSLPSAGFAFEKLPVHSLKQ